MSKVADRLNTIDAMFTEAARQGLLQLTAENEILDGRIIHLEGRPLINFGVCSYLGLEMDPRLKQGAIDAILRYGTQFSSSRVYLSAPCYRELEDLLRCIADAPVMVAPTTTLGHLAAIPTLIQDDDAVILDQHVHHSVQMAVELVRTCVAHVEVVRHSDMQALDRRLADLTTRYHRIWYLADGVYSIFGDLVPIEELKELLRRYPTLHLYLYDAHGMSWSGLRGCGYVLSHLPERDRTVVALSMSKGFSAGGAVLVFPDTESLRRVRTGGGPMIFSGPLQPPVLGAAIASARIHLSDELPAMQQNLLDRVRLCNRLMLDKGLPLISHALTPIRFVGVGRLRVVLNLMRRMMDEGFFPNIVGFPATPMNQTGLRITITLHQTEGDIRSLVDALAYHLPLALEEEGSGPDEIAKFFRHSLAKQSIQERRGAMATGAFVIVWGPTVRGRELKALQVFNETIEHFFQLQQQGTIESFEPVDLEPNGGDLGGFLLVRGDREKLNALRASEEFLRLNIRASLVVDNLGVINAFIGEELQRVFANLGTQASELSQASGTLGTPAV